MNTSESATRTEPTTEPKWWPHGAVDALRSAYRTRNTVNGKTFDEILEAALAATRAAPPPPLTVETLMSALVDAENDDQMGPDYQPERLAEYLVDWLARPSDPDPR